MKITVIITATVHISSCLQKWVIILSLRVWWLDSLSPPRSWKTLCLSYTEFTPMKKKSVLLSSTLHVLNASELLMNIHMHDWLPVSLPLIWKAALRSCRCRKDPLPRTLKTSRIFKIARKVSKNDMSRWIEGVARVFTENLQSFMKFTDLGEKQGKFDGMIVRRKYNGENISLFSQGGIS